MLTGQECERLRRQQALHCGHSGKSGQRGRRVATGLRGYGACEAAEGVVQKSGAKDESSRSGTLTFNGTHASERGAAARKVEWGPALREFENFVGSRFTPACNTSGQAERMQACKGLIEHIMHCMPYPRGAIGRRFGRSVT